ncbi:hypothetical protein WISP_22622 [Willisornis vidua]|uniref:Uncharacterized protein n=1 Tax=Willisornis vidua TaxID=1566151 RepID=A0ABQ9DMY1_9PASS|nr:hypothetical protein WISP_22622 [Willisornis vidua]
MVKRLCPCSPRSAEIHQQPVEKTHAGAGGYLKEAVTPWEAPAGPDSWQAPADPWRKKPKVDQVFLVGIVTFWRTHSGAGLKGCTPWKGTTLEQFMKTYSLWKDSGWKLPHTGAGKGFLSLNRGRNHL